ncbi:MAG: glucose 1-dehydrogenase [Thermoproteota archaeon]|jgi:glucose 1-dehydrogenase|nr:glucose 1-dehydrogenase [Thermoproteota archaeon]
MRKKIALVTGSSRGIGKAIAATLARSNDYSGIVINSRNKEETQKTSDEMKGSFDCQSIPIAADISKEPDCIRLIEETVAYFGRIDVLVNNAGIQEELDFTEISLDDWYKIIGVDLTGPFVCSREAVKKMQKQENPKGGCIVNVSSVHQTIPKPFYVPYATSKAGIEMMTKSMALEIAKDGIRANVVAPGAIKTEMNKELNENKVELERVLKRIPVGRIGDVDEIANVVEFIVSDKASYITGTTFFVDGGMTLYPAFNSV